MHDIRTIRDDPAAFDAAMARRGVEQVSAKILQLDTIRRARMTMAEQAVAVRNSLSASLGSLFGNQKATLAGLQNATATMSPELIAKIEDELDQIDLLITATKQRLLETDKAEIERLEREAADSGAQLDALLAGLPNLPATHIPNGSDEHGNVVVSEFGRRRDFAFAPREHFDFGPALGLDFESAQRVSGARFAYLRGPVARLSRALGQFMLDVHTSQFGYEEVNPPLLVRDEAAFGTAQLPKFKADLFRTTIPLDFDWVDSQIEKTLAESRMSISEVHSDAFWTQVKERTVQSVKEAHKQSNILRRWLIPTAEVSLTNIVRERILPEAMFPIRFTALTPCFRSEAGAAGRDTRGLIRQHQFEKVELVSIVRPEESDGEHERMTRAAETILELLGLPFRRMLLCAGDMGFAARKTYDLEVWLPGAGQYREISSCSNCGDFQARRMNARYRPEGEKGTRFVHTLNGSGVAVGRALVAVLENYQQADGSVLVPEALLPYMGGVTRLVP